MNNSTLKISIVIPTLGRRRELDTLLKSIEASTYRNIEIIIVDQNDNCLIDDIVDRYEAVLAINHEKVSFTGAARSRNHGLQFATGEIVFFPDDDAFLNPDTLEKAVSFLKDSDCDGVAARVIDPESGKSALLKFSNCASYITASNFFRLTIEFNILWKRDALAVMGGFDDRLGVGTYFSSEESADLILRAFKKNCKIFYLPSILVFHPDNRNQSAGKIFGYGRGFGALLYKHKRNRNIYPYARRYIGNAFVGVFIFLLIKPKKSLCYVARLLGTLVGFMRARGVFRDVF